MRKRECLCVKGREWKKERESVCVCVIRECEMDRMIMQRTFTTYYHFMSILVFTLSIRK